jgi:DNA-directed RNA polymerase beta' subunit
MGLGKILNINNALEAELEKGNNMPQIMEKWDALHINVALYINSETPGIPPTIVPAKPTRGTTTTSFILDIPCVSCACRGSCRVALGC